MYLHKENIVVILNLEDPSIIVGQITSIIKTIIEAVVVVVVYNNCTFYRPIFLLNIFINPAIVRF